MKEDSRNVLRRQFRNTIFQISFDLSLNSNLYGTQTTKILNSSQLLSNTKQGILKGKKQKAAR